MNDYPKDIEAEVYVLTAQEGGRARPVFSAYRPQFRVDGSDWDSVIELPETLEKVLPGQTIIAYLSFATPKNQVDRLYVGKEFLLREGSIIVAKGTVTKILNLKENAEKSKF
jgi:translation elongation factor EF-Tu-like GTPase